jgi:hypothetical protein
VPESSGGEQGLRIKFRESDLSDTAPVIFFWNALCLNE